MVVSHTGCGMLFRRDKFYCRAFVLIQSDMQNGRWGLGYGCTGKTCAYETCETHPYTHWLRDREGWYVSFVKVRRIRGLSSLRERSAR